MTANDLCTAVSAWYKARDRAETRRLSDAETNRAVATQVDAERRIVRLVTAIVGRLPVEDRPVYVMLDGVPIVACMNDNGEVRAAIPEPLDVVELAVA
jgi:hypothetical protein